MTVPGLGDLTCYDIYTAVYMDTDVLPDETCFAFQQYVADTCCGTVSCYVCPGGIAFSPSNDCKYQHIAVYAKNNDNTTAGTFLLNDSCSNHIQRPRNRLNELLSDIIRRVRYWKYCGRDVSTCPGGGTRNVLFVEQQHPCGGVQEMCSLWRRRDRIPRRQHNSSPRRRR